MPALMSLDDRVMHMPSTTHGVALCGEAMRDPWLCGPVPDVASKSDEMCLDCFHLAGR